MKIEIELTGFTPVLDNLIQEYDLVTAAIYGIVWRYAQMSDKICKAPLKKIGNRLDLSGKTAERHIKKLCVNGYLVDLTPDVRNKPHSYAVTGKAEVSGSIVARSDSLSDQGQTESPTRSDRESDQGQTESPLKIHDKKQTKKHKASSANADHSRPVSLLSEKEVKALTLTLADWKQHLTDEQAEKGRKGVISFIEGKIRYGQLRPVNDDEKTFFQILAVEYEADGGKSPPEKFPTLDTKRLFNEAAEYHNGTLEAVVRKAIHKRGKGIAKIVDYINSPEWKKDDNDRQRTVANRQQKPDSKASRGQSQGSNFSPPAGSGQTPEMAARLRAAFAPK